jgi:hypothetical protein
VLIIAAAAVEEATQVARTFIAVATKQNMVLNSKSQLNSDNSFFLFLFYDVSFQTQS